MTVEASSPEAAVAGLARSDPHGPGLTRVRDQDGFRYQDPSGAQVTDAATLDRIRALRIPPAWEHAWIAPDPLGHIQATGVDGRGRLQYLYHQLWRELRDAQKFGHMLSFADALPALRTAAAGDLKRRGLTRERVVAGVVRLIDLGLFRIGGERYAELDHHYGATTLRKQHVRVTRDGVTFDYVAKAGKRRTIVISDELVVPTVRALVRSDNGLDTLWCFQERGAWHILHSRDVGNYIARRAGGHFTAKEFRTWHATVLMALALANAGSAPTPQRRQHVVAASVKEVARWLGDTPAVARGSYIDPRLISHYESEGELATVPARPAGLPVPAEVENAVAALLARYEQARTAGAPLIAARRTLFHTERAGPPPRFFIAPRLDPPGRRGHPLSHAPRPPPAQPSALSLRRTARRRPGGVPARHVQLPGRRGAGRAAHVPGEPGRPGGRSGRRGVRRLRDSVRPRARPEHARAQRLLGLRAELRPTCPGGRGRQLALPAGQRYLTWRPALRR